MRGRILLIAALGALGACGDDGQAANPPPANAQPKPNNQPGGGAGSNKNTLPEKLHVEERISCALPEKPTDPKNGKCDLKAPSCGEHLYCLDFGGSTGAFCEPCPERDGIRHAFRERDFAGEQNRDPFEAGGSIGPRPAGQAVPPTERCRRDDQMVATSYSFLDLKLVGIVAQGTQRKVLMMGGPLGYIIKRGDCVGKEKAMVSDIGTGYITFQTDSDAAGNGRPPQEYSIQLNPKQLAANDPESVPQAQRTTIAPVVAPPPVIPPAPNTPTTRAGTTVVMPPPAAPPGGAAAVPPGGTAVVPPVVPASASPTLPPASAAGSANAGSAANVPLVTPPAPAGSGAAGSGAAGSAAPAPSNRVFVAPPK